MKKRPAPWNKGKTKLTDKRVKKISLTFKRKRLDNFFNWRETARIKGIIPDTAKPFKKGKKLAFLIGLVLGDGYLNKSSRTEVLRITLGTDKPKLWQYTTKVVTDIFDKIPYVHKRLRSAAVDIRIYQNNIARRIEIPLGRKRNKKLKLPRWIWDNKSLLIACLKGLFEAEGSLSIHNKTSTFNFSFSNTNIELLNQVQRALIYIGFHPERRSNAVRLRKKAEALSFKELINFRNYP